MYKCNDCGYVFEEPKMISEEELYGVDDIFPTSLLGKRIAVCPSCSSPDCTDLEEDE